MKLQHVATCYNMLEHVVTRCNMLQHVRVGGKNSATGTRTRVARVRAEYPNQLDYSGIVSASPVFCPRICPFGWIGFGA